MLIALALASVLFGGCSLYENPVHDPRPDAGAAIDAELARDAARSDAEANACVPYCHARCLENADCYATCLPRCEAGAGGWTPGPVDMPLETPIR